MLLEQLWILHSRLISLALSEIRRQRVAKGLFDVETLHVVLTQLPFELFLLKGLSGLPEAIIQKSHSHTFSLLSVRVKQVSIDLFVLD